MFREHAGHDLDLAQANCSVSAAGVLRGIHFSDVPPGQAKYVTCVRGAALDVVVDIRVGSPTFGQWDSVLLDDVDRREIYLAEGLGHAFMALEDDTTIVYLCSTGYAPGREHGVRPARPGDRHHVADVGTRRIPDRAAAVGQGPRRAHAGRCRGVRPAAGARRATLDYVRGLA